MDKKAKNLKEEKNQLFPNLKLSLEKNFLKVSLVNPDTKYGKKPLTERKHFIEQQSFQLSPDTSFCQMPIPDVNYKRSPPSKFGSLPPIKKLDGNSSMIEETEEIMQLRKKVEFWGQWAKWADAGWNARDELKRLWSKRQLSDNGQFKQRNQIKKETYQLKKWKL